MSEVPMPKKPAAKKKPQPKPKPHQFGRLVIPRDVVKVTFPRGMPE